MIILQLQHSDIGGSGRLGATLRDTGFCLDIRRPDLHPVGHANGVPTDLDDVHGIVILGGPQNVTDITRYPWMEAEANLIRQAHAREIPIIGICLGAQLIGHALGGEVSKRPKPSIGLDSMDLNITGQTETLLAGLPWKSPQLFSCTQEVSKLPPGATVLASCKSTKSVIFKVGLRTFASLAHFECDRPMADAIMSASERDMPDAGITPGEIRAHLDQEYNAYARVSDRLCVNLATYLFPATRRLSA